MAGRPMLEALEKTIEDLGGETWVFDQIADGVVIGEVARQLGVSRRMIYRWRDYPAHKARRREMWDEAMRCASEARLEQSLGDFDRLDRVIALDEEGRPVNRVPHPAEVQLVTGRAKYRQWLAGKYDPERFGDRTQVGVQLNVAELHLAAVQEAKRLNRAPAMPVEATVDGEPVEASMEDGG